MSESRAWGAGEALGKVIIEMVNLMYQNNTALKFMRALSIEIDTELERREDLNKEK